MDNVYDIAMLANGVEVQIRPVSPHVRQGLHRRLEEELPLKPELPMKQKRSVDGHTEEAPAQEGDPEYEQWKKEYTEWDKAAEKVRGRINNDNMLRFIVYAVVGWRKGIKSPFLRFLRLKLNLNWFWSIFGLGWHHGAPAAWEPDRITRVPSDMTKDHVFTLTELISAESDYALIQYKALPMMRELLTQEEVGRQLDGFPPDS